MLRAVIAVVAITLSVSCLRNRPPVIETIAANPETVSVNGQTKIEVLATDPDGDALRYSWQAESGSLSPSTADTVTWFAPKLVGTYMVALTVRDSKDSYTDTSIAITVQSGERR
jgi:chitinase